MERVGEGRELGFAILLTCVSVIIGYRLDIGGVQRSVDIYIYIFLFCYWFSRMEKRRQYEQVNWQKAEGIGLYSTDRSPLMLYYCDAAMLRCICLDEVR